ncbi:Si-specific NAD(P)(+) transhydrogenase [Balneolales bacterium ANBcel1]|nr:Si-specific NAD(P)(+) transhydrogenase [Balneolales bacterium ANBcel1]
MSRDYDVIILGSGPAGFSCAMQSAKFDKKALIIEANEHYLGGSWINTGTVPSKALRETASNIFKYSSRFGDTDGVKPYDRFKMRDVLKYKDIVLASENSEIKENLIKNEVDTELGFGTIVDPHTVEVKKEDGSVTRFTTDYILVSTGGQTVTPKKFEVDHATILDNRSILDLNYIPKRLVIVGTNVQAVEFATIFTALGTRVTILNEKEDYLVFLDREAKKEFDEIISDMRISVFNNTEVIDISTNSLRNCTEVKFREKETDSLHVTETEQVLYFGERKPNTRNLGLESLDMEFDEQGFIKVDHHYRTNIPSIFAAGDVIGHPGLASVSFSQGRISSCNMFGASSLEMHSSIPYGIYSIPEIASIGLTEREARAQSKDITIGRAYYRNLTKANISQSPRGILKLVFETESLKLLGIHIVGEGACDLIHIGQAVLHYNGDVRYFLNTVHNYPTYSEAYRIAAFNGVNRVYKSGVKYKTLLDDK